MNLERCVEELKIIKEELAIENKEKIKRAAELVIANIELAFQNAEKAKRAAELMLANKELIFQNEEKGKRAAELIIANIELAYQSQEKAKRAAELIIANKEHSFESEQKEKCATELRIANTELAYQNKEKEKRAAELNIVNKELEQFAFIASHDLQQPLRTVSNYLRLLEEKYLSQLDEDARKYINSTNNAIKRMNLLINSLLIFSQLGNNRKLANVDLKIVLEEVIADHEILIKNSGALIEMSAMPALNIYETEMRQLFQNLITNAIKFQKVETQPKISISAEQKKDKWQFAVKDNGIGIEAIHYEKIFDIFQRLNSKAEYEGSGIGLANCKKIVQLHKGDIWLESKPKEGSTFYFTIPNLAVSATN
ncbi:MAG: GHKL domain-containing protein [Bacteroidetes bacterium]|nr:GHKL domain-containing protein [Bacteroidota bacterium]